MERKVYKLRLNINQAQLILSVLEGVGYIGPAKKFKKQYLKQVRKLTEDMDNEL